MPQAELPIFSIIIPTYKRKESLVRLIHSIEEQTFKDYEIIVVNDDDENPLELSPGLSSKVRVINNRSNLGINFSRMIGSRAANGNLVFFVDDDNVMPRELLKNLLTTFNEVTERIAVIAPIAFHLTRPDKIWWSGTQIGKYSLFSRFTELKQSNNSNLIDTQDVHNAFAVRRNYIDIFYSVDSRFKRTYPTVVFSKKLRDQGLSLALATNCLIYHDIPVSDLSQIGLLISLVKSGRFDCDRLFHYYYEPILYSKLCNRYGLRVINSIFQIMRGIFTLLILIGFDKRMIKQRFSQLKCIFAGQFYGMNSTG